MASIIIPAHDEEAVISETLSQLLDGLGTCVRVVVVCNGCSDRTVERAARFEPRVEIAEASKAAALNAGEAHAPGFPRIYLDADVRLAGSSAERVLAALSTPGALAAEVDPSIELGRSSFPVRAFYRVWRGLHGRRPGDVGCGLFALSERGRSRFDAFPPVLSDDAFVRAHFLPGETQVVSGAHSVVRAPTRLGALIRIKTRSRLGVIELGRRFPDLWAGKRARQPSLLRKLLAMPPRLWPLAPVYVFVQVAARLRARSLLAAGTPYRWERDATSR